MLEDDRDQLKNKEEKRPTIPPNPNNPQQATHVIELDDEDDEEETILGRRNGTTSQPPIGHMDGGPPS